jgi:acetyltransferase
MATVQAVPGRRRAASLHSFLHPESIAVIGASDVAGKVGHTVMHNLLAASFPGEVYPVNSTRESVMGRRAYRNVSAIPDIPELAVIVTPAQTVPRVIEECASKQVPAALIISAGFRETGPTGQKLEDEVRAHAQRSGMRVIGPNCLGVMSPPGHVNATFAASMALPGQVAFLSQSGALCTAVLDWSLSENVGFSALVSLGSMLDVGWADVIRYFGEDPTTKCIVMYMETVGDPRSFVTAAREVAFRKPIVVIKAGRSEAAARATMSHTGSLAGSDAVLDAAFRRCGVLRVKTIADVFYMADVLGKQPRPSGPKLTIVTNAGGPSVLATDALVEYEGTLAELSSATLDELDRLLPAHWSHGNPIDVLGDASAETYVKASKAALADPATDGLLAIVTPQGVTSPADIARALVKNNRFRKPILASFMGGDGMRNAESILNSAGIPSFPYPDSAARVFEYMWQYSRNLHSLCPFGRAAQRRVTSGFVKRIAMKRSVDNRVLVRFRPKDHILDFFRETPGLDSFGQWRRAFDIGHEHFQSCGDRFGLLAEFFDIACPGHYVCERSGCAIRLPIKRFYFDEPNPQFRLLHSAPRHAFVRASGGSSRASTPRGWPSAPGYGAATPSGNRTSWRHITGRCGSAS